MRYLLVPLWAKDGTIRGYVSVSEQSAEYASGIRWMMTGTGYASRYQRGAGGMPGRYVLMHRDLLGLVPGDGLEADHIDHDPLNNELTWALCH